VAEHGSGVQAQQDGHAIHEVPLSAAGRREVGCTDVDALAQADPPSGSELGPDVLVAIADGQRFPTREDAEA
jgi:hypothetical protein